MGILRGEALDEESIAPADRERLAQMGEELPLIARRFGRIRIAVLTTWIAIGLFVLSVTAIAVAVTANSEGFAFAALALVLAGVALVFAASCSYPAPRRPSSTRSTGRQLSAMI